jgi:hypothetical protein
MELKQSTTDSKPAGSESQKRILMRDCPKLGIVRLLVTIVLVLVVVSGFVDEARGSSSMDWSFLQNSYWYVPTVNLPALLSSTANGGTFIPITDQTVFYIQRYVKGYFWGTVATELTVAGQSRGPACFQMVGSVTPEGTVNLSFTPTGSSGAPTAGFGTMRPIGRQWTMENQMSTSQSGGTATHWAYMVQCRVGQPCMRSLPGTDLTIAQLLDDCS